MLSSIDKQIGLRLKIARQSFPYKTATLFCTTAGIPHSTYSQHENGYRSLTAESLMKYGHLLEIDPRWLLTGIGHPCPASKNSGDRKEFIDNEIRKLQINNLLSAIPTDQITAHTDYALVNVELFIYILTLVINKLNKPENQYSGQEMMTFCLEIYNELESMNLSPAEREKIIDLSLNAYIRGSKLISH